MTAHVHDSSARHAGEAAGAVPAARAGGTTRPRWLLPAIVAGLVVAVLVAYGILSPSAVLYGGLFGGMLLMHAGGHGGHGNIPSDGPRTSDSDDNVERRSHGCH